MEQYSTEEGDNVTVCIVLSGQTERDVTVRVNTADGEAQGKPSILQLLVKCMALWGEHEQIVLIVGRYADRHI